MLKNTRRTFKSIWQSNTQLITLLLMFNVNFIMAKESVWFDEKIHQTDKILVKLLDDSLVEVTDGKLNVVDNNHTRFQQVSQLNHLGKYWQNVFSSEKEKLKQWRNQAVQNTNKSYADLTSFFYVNTTDQSDMKSQIAQMRLSPLVEGVYPVAKPAQPPLPPNYEYSSDENSDPDYGNMYQRFFNEAPVGMDIHYAREGIGGKGDGISVCDVEYGWKVHNDQPQISNLKVPGFDYPDIYNSHGTAVLGMLGSKDNDWGTTGMITESEFVFSPIWPINEPFNVAAAISNCMNQIDIGDIILIEIQTQGLNGQFVPMEWDPTVHAVISIATAVGYVVIEAAGNGGQDLDDVFYNTAQPGFTPFTAANDSGAIIVGSASSAWSPTPRERRISSTYGDTVDLHAWGNDIIAPGYGTYYDDDGDSLSYILFSGTSGASPMVTAAAAIIQANYIAKNGSPATPTTIKQLLRNTGTPQVNVSGENIGPMPDLKKAINTLWEIEEISPPSITPKSGSYSMPLQLTIDYAPGDNSSNTHIRYTLNGSEPTIDSFVYLPDQGDSIYLNYGLVVKAKSFKNIPSADRLFASETASSIIISTTPKVATPQITPDGGVFNQGTSLVITTTTEGAEIKYRTDGRTPSFFYPGTVYNGPISLNPGSYLFRARAYKDGYYKSDTAIADQVTINPLTLPTPVIYPNSGEFNGEVTVYLGSTVLGATIRYTTNGSEPNTTSTIFNAPITIDSNSDVKAKVFLDGYSPSLAVSASYTIINQAIAPTITPPNGSSADDTMQVIISTPTTGADIRYTTNNAEPTSYSSLYNNPITLSPGQHIIKAKAFVSGAIASETSTANLTVFDTSITVSPPKINPVGGIFNAPVTISMTSDTDGVSLIFYTLDGTDPETSGSVQSYNGPFELLASPDTYFIKARAFLSGSGNSDISSATFSIVDPVFGPIETPTITPDSGIYYNTINVSVQAPDFSSPFNIRRLYVTRNGDEPVADFSSTGNGTSGSYNFNLSSPESVQALAAQAGWFDSDISSQDYTFKCATPIISEGGTFIDNTNVTISTETTNADIYYTIDGSEPNTASQLYSDEFNITQNQVVKAMCVRNNFIDSDIAVSVFIINQTPISPVITTQPQDLKINSCGNALFTVVATGTEVLEYQWYRDGNVIAAANEPELNIFEVSPNDSGEYQVLVKNDASSVLSNAVTLIVPIFSSGFEESELSTICTVNNNINNINNTSNELYNKSSQNKTLSTIENANQIINSTHAFDGISQLIKSNKHQTGKNYQNNIPNVDQLNQGDQPSNAVQVIPSLNHWAKLLFLLMVMIVLHYKRSQLTM